MLFNRKRIVITGGTGSLGKILTRGMLGGKEGRPKNIIIFSRDEAKQHDMRLSYQHKQNGTDGYYDGKTVYQYHERRATSLRSWYH